MYGWGTRYFVIHVYRPGGPFQRETKSVVTDLDQCTVATSSKQGRNIYTSIEAEEELASSLFYILTIIIVKVKGYLKFVKYSKKEEPCIVTL